MEKKELFTSRMGLILAALGMAVGTGNIWRFPRIIAQNGGGTFLIPWIIFLFLWSIPLLICEFGLGRGTRKGTIGAFGTVMGRKFGWMGTYVGFCAMGIMFYYSVVTGWCFKYLFASISGSVFSVDNGIDFWNSFISTQYEPLFFHFMAMTICAFIVYKGVVKGIEKVNKVLIPSLFALLLVALVRSLTLPGAMEGVNFLFTPVWSDLLNYKIWLEGLTQSAWSTGAAWGLLLTYAVYMKEKEDIVLNSGIIGFGDYSISLIAALCIVPIVFALTPNTAEAVDLVTQSGPASTGLTFIWIPQLFEQMPGGKIILIFFFLALSFAAISSLISMVELSTRIFMDMGLARKKAILIVGSVAFILGAPSAINMGFFGNQDWVWSAGLVVSGFFISMAAIKYGVTKFRENFVNVEGNDINIGKIFNIAVFLIPVQFVVLLWWWFYQAGGWTDIFSSYSVGTCLLQWGIAITVFIILNKKLMNLTLGEEK
ncbi:MAG: sodium-dependent transporter [bacterium]|nr:sodium-dependent transporter [bacterium]